MRDEPQPAVLVRILVDLGHALEPEISGIVSDESVPVTDDGGGQEADQDHAELGHADPARVGKGPGDEHRDAEDQPDQAALREDVCTLIRVHQHDERPQGKRCGQPFEHEDERERVPCLRGELGAFVPRERGEKELVGRIDG
jgi:hypothetical protein